MFTQHQLPKFLLAQKQADLQREIEHNKLVIEAEKARAHRQGFIANELHALSIWLIHKGERIHERYHARSNVCSY